MAPKSMRHCAHCGKVLAPPARLYCSLRCQFESHVSPAGNGCLLWTAAQTKQGYGVLSYRDRRGILAHRVAWELAHGPVPDGVFVCHACDVPACVSVAHLFLGTAAENMHDKIAKGRSGNVPHSDATRKLLSDKASNRTQAQRDAAAAQMRARWQDPKWREEFSRKKRGNQYTAKAKK